MTARNLLIFLSMKYDGDWDKIFEDIQNRRTPNVSGDFMLPENAITILDSDYPERLKQIYKPPFVLFYHGNKDLLKSKNLSVFVSDTPIENEYYDLALSKMKQAENGAIVSSSNHDMVVMTKNAELGDKTIYVSSIGGEPRKLGGLSISEYYKAKDHKEHMTARIMAGLCGDNAYIFKVKKGNVVTCGLLSWLLELGKEINVLPILHNSEGLANNILIQEGATPILP